MQKPEVADFRYRAAETKDVLGGGLATLADQAGHSWRNLLDTGRDHLEEHGIDFRQLGDDLKANAKKRLASSSARRYRGRVRQPSQ